MASDGIGLVHLIVGTDKTGKSTYIKFLLDKMTRYKRVIHDVNKEYSNNTVKNLLVFNDFTELAARQTNAIIVFEEATIFLTNQSRNEKIRELCVRKRHNHNYIIFVFHSWNSVPREIFNLCNYATLFHTCDKPEYMRKNWGDTLVYDYWLSLNKMNYHDKKTLNTRAFSR